MRCGELSELIHGYIDGELDLSRSLEIEEHIGACPSCRQTYTDNLSLRQAIAGGSLYFEAPEDMRKRVRSAVRQANKSEPGSRQLRGWKLIWAPLGAVALALLLVFILRISPGADSVIALEAVSAHVRSLMPGHLVDVPTSDQHTVKPWFNGKLDFSPTVKDLGTDGFVLLGGRLDYVGDRPVAAVVYQRRKHLINLFVWPSTDSGGSGEKSFTQHGYNLIRWAQSGMEYWAVSDISETELRQFAALLRK